MSVHHLSDPSVSALRTDGVPRRSADRHALGSELLCVAAESCDDQEKQELYDQTVLLYADVAQSVASRYRRRGIPKDDLEQAAYEGLVKAVRRFDPSRRHDFLSFAMPTIRGEVQRYFRDHGWTVRPPRRIQDLQWRLHRAIDELSQELGREPTQRELEQELGVGPAELSEAERAYGSFTPASIDRPVQEEGGLQLSDLLADDDHEARASEARLVLGPAVRRLDQRDRRILYLRFCEDRTQAEIGEEIGVTQMQVSRVLSRILRDLRAELEQASA